ncbi:MAG TPA: FAD binding domain-containing protein [Acidimicrobiia bacterium]|nr:FAD binding domain-containing protein [Acidimicrobiia bacterium]
MTASTVEEAVAALASGARAIAGGTDLVVGGRQGKKPLPESLVGIHRLAGLGSIEETADGLVLGALVTHAAIATSDPIQARYTAIADASALVGSHATRANGTIGGNVMNASPAMDTGAPLLCLGAKAELVGPGGTRRVDLAELWTGPGTTSARPDELLVSIRIPIPPAGTGTSYVRLQYRRQMEIAVVGAAVALTWLDGIVTQAAVAITALAPTIHRVVEAEAALVGTDGNPSAIKAASEAAAAAARPIGDVRASVAYRRAMAVVITRRAIQAALARARGETVVIPASESTYGS